MTSERTFVIVVRALRTRHDGDPAAAAFTPAELRAAALIQALTQTMRVEPSEHSAPDRYRVILTFTPESLFSHVALCDSAMHLAIINSKSEVLSIGPTTRLWPTTTRRAVTLRDEGCIFPGCGWHL